MPEVAVGEGAQRARDGAADRRDQLVDVFRPRRVVGQVLPGQPGRAEREGDHVGRLPAGAGGHVDGAATDVHHGQGRARTAVPAPGGVVGDGGFVARAEHADPDPGRLAQLPAQLGAVGRVPDSGGAERDQRVGALVHGGTHAVPHRTNRLLHARLGDQAVCSGVFGEPGPGLHTPVRTRHPGAVEVDDFQARSGRPDVQQSQFHAAPTRAPRGSRSGAADSMDDIFPLSGSSRPKIPPHQGFLERCVTFSGLGDDCPMRLTRR